MAALGRQGHTNELKGAYLYLASDASTFCTGHDMVSDGARGATVLVTESEANFDDCTQVVDGGYTLP